MIDPEAALLMADSQFALGREYSAALGAATSGRLELTRGAVHLTVTGDAPPDLLFDARFGSTVANVIAAGSTVRVVYHQHRTTKRAAPGRVALNASIPWTLSFHYGVARVRVDVQALRVDGLTIEGGVSEVEILLPRPSGVVPLTITGGMHHVLIRRPADVPIRLTLRGGATSVAFDEQQFGAVGGKLVLVSPRFEGADASYDVTATGGASGITIV